MHEDKRVRYKEARNVFGTRVMRHGFLYKNARMCTVCACGCYYSTPMRKVQVADASKDVYYQTRCPECKALNSQEYSELKQKFDKECKEYDPMDDIW